MNATITVPMRALWTASIFAALAVLLLVGSADANYANRPEVATGAAHTCALADDGSVKCWGANTSGQLGNGSAVDSPTPVPIAGVVTAKTNEAPPAPTLGSIDGIATAAASTCALSSGTIWCWGANDHGQLGIGSVDSDAHPTPQAIVGSKDFYAITAGASHFCAATWQGELSCWGANAVGQIGSGSVGGDVATPTKVAGVNKFKSIAAGADFSCVLLKSTTPWCWGSGIGTPAEVAGLKDMHELVAGASSVCGWGWTEVAMRCWPGATPGAATGIEGISDVKAFGGTADSTCVLAKTYAAANYKPWTATRSLQCWGQNAAGQLGSGDNLASTTPRLVNLSGVGALSIGSSSTKQCAVVVGGAVFCWGDGVLSPTEVAGLDLVTRPQLPDWSAVDPVSRLRSDRAGTAWRIGVRVKVAPSPFVTAEDTCRGRVSISAYYYKRMGGIEKGKKAMSAPLEKRVGVSRKVKLRQSGEYCKAQAVLKIPKARFAGKLRKMKVSAKGIGNSVTATFETNEFALKDVRKLLKKKK